jgi:hypothetical protein
MVDQSVRRLLAFSASYSLYPMVTLFLIVLRVAGQITWSWIWIFSPLWIPFSLAGIAFASVVIAKVHGQPVRRAIPRHGPADSPPYP